ncbi:MAG TPA: DUF1802 family protein [Phycisphaerae bacterium]
MLTIALKEWDLVIRKMLEGRQAVLLRKGGILEAENQFVLEHREFLFFPTFVHQDPRMVKPEHRAGLVQVRAEPEVVRIGGFGRVEKIYEVPSRQALEALSDLYVWDMPLLDMRFTYRPEKPLYLVLVRAYKFGKAVEIKNTLEYAGCKSWVPLEVGVDVDAAEAVLGEAGFLKIQQHIEKAFS